MCSEFGLAARSRLCTKRYNERLYRRNKIVNEAPPCLKRGTPLLQVGMPVVDGGHAADRSAGVVEHLVNDLWWNQPRHAGRSRARDSALMTAYQRDSSPSG
jgi:hypothetical protein